jgi:hypothetical protein
MTSTWIQTTVLSCTRPAWDESSVLLPFSGAGLGGSKPDVISRLEQGTEPCIPYLPRTWENWSWKHKMEGESSPVSAASAGGNYNLTRLFSASYQISCYPHGFAFFLLHFLFSLSFSCLLLPLLIIHKYLHVFLH